MRVSAESVSFLAATGALVWAPVAELVPTTVKAIAGSVLAAVGAIGAGKTWMEKRRRDRGDEDR